MSYPFLFGGQDLSEFSTFEVGHSCHFWIYNTLTFRSINTMLGQDLGNVAATAERE